MPMMVDCSEPMVNDRTRKSRGGQQRSVSRGALDEDEEPEPTRPTA